VRRHHRRTPLADSTDDEWDAILSVNLRGAVNSTRKLFPLMRERARQDPRGRLDRGQERRRRLRPAYVASKAACTA
jgi:3-oxoacyl-[acyl-carrier protein] reductase